MITTLALLNPVIPLVVLVNMKLSVVMIKTNAQTIIAVLLLDARLLLLIITMEMLVLLTVVTQLRVLSISQLYVTIRMLALSILAILR